MEFQKKLPRVFDKNVFDGLKGRSHKNLYYCSFSTFILESQFLKFQNLNISLKNFEI